MHHLARGLWAWDSPGHDIGHWPAGPTAIFSCRASSGHKHAFFTGPNEPLGNSSGHWWVWRTLARRRWWLCLQSPRKQQTVASLLMGICHHRVAVPWLCLALSLMTQPTAQSIMWLPDTATRLECIGIATSAAVLCIQPSPRIALVAVFRFQSQRVSVCKSQYPMLLRDCI